MMRFDVARMVLADTPEWRADGTRITTLVYENEGAVCQSKVKLHRSGQTLRFICPACGEHVKALGITARGLMCDRCRKRGTP